VQLIRRFAACAVLCEAQVLGEVQLLAIRHARLLY
jgi:hypothetical protein